MTPSFMNVIRLSTKQWKRFKSLLPKGRSLYVKSEKELKNFFDALLWMARSGAQWRLLPHEYGNWNSIFRRFSRWEKRGIFAKISQAASGNANLEELMLDSTIVRANPGLAGALKKTAFKNKIL